MVRSRRRLGRQVNPVIPLGTILEAVADDTITFTSRAALDSGVLRYTRSEVRSVLARLTPQDFRETVQSQTKPDTTMDVYAITDRRTLLYIKFQEKQVGMLLLVSFHRAKYRI